MKRYSGLYLTLLGSWTVLLLSEPTLALPPPEDIPEERLRTQIIVEARSPIDGKPLTAAEYVQLQNELAVSAPPQVSDEVRRLLFLLRLRRLIRTIIPF